MDYTHDILLNLCDPCHQEDMLRIFDIQEQRFLLKQDDQSITWLFMTLKKLCQELEKFLPSLLVLTLLNFHAIYNPQSTHTKRERSHHLIPNRFE